MLLGIVAATHQNSWLDYTVTTLATLGCCVYHPSRLCGSPPYCLRSTTEAQCAPFVSSACGSFLGGSPECMGIVGIGCGP